LLPSAILFGETGKPVIETAQRVTQRIHGVIVANHFTTIPGIMYWMNVTHGLPVI
jgi:hypothetical protein